MKRKERATVVCFRSSAGRTVRYASGHDPRASVDWPSASRLDVSYSYMTRYIQSPGWATANVGSLGPRVVGGLSAKASGPTLRGTSVVVVLSRGAAAGAPPPAGALGSAAAASGPPV